MRFIKYCYMFRRLSVVANIFIAICVNYLNKTFLLIEKINAALRERRDCIYFFKLL